MTYPPSSSGYPPSQQPTTQFSAPTQQFGKHEQPSAQSPAATAAVPSKLPFILLAAIARTRSAGVPVQLRSPVQDREHRLPAVGQRHRHVARARPGRRRCAALRADRGGQPAAQAEGARRHHCGGRRAGVPARDRRGHPDPGGRQPRLGAVRRDLPDIRCRPRSVSAPCCSTRASSRRRCRSPSSRSTTSRSTASTARPNQYYGQHAPHQGGPAAASALPGPVRRRLLGRAVVRRWLCRLSASRAARRPRRPVSRPTASRRRRSLRRPARPRAAAAAVVVLVAFVESVRQLAVIISCRASVNPARASKELLYR